MRAASCELRASFSVLSKGACELRAEPWGDGWASFYWGPCLGSNIPGARGASRATSR